MKEQVLIKFFALLFILFVSAKSKAQNPENWTSKQLIEPSQLAANIASKKDVPVIISVGPGAAIASSIDVGMVNNTEGLDKLKAQLKSIDKDTKIVIYCGCCPFEHCPNVRPAIEALKELKFTNYYLLDLPHNIKKDWIEKGYPLSKS